MLKIADKKLSKIGFIKTYEGDNVVSYEKDKEYTIQVVSIVRSRNGKHIFLKSYPKSLYNVNMSIETNELKWFYRKMKEFK